MTPARCLVLVRIFLMNLTTEHLSDTRKKITVAISAEETAQEYQGILKEFVKQAKVPGFRPGKIPTNIVERKYSKELSEELTRKCLTKAYNHVVTDSGFEVYTVVDAEEPEVVKGVEVSFEVTVDVNPEFELPEYKEIPVTLVPVEVTDQDVDDMIDEIRKQRAEFNVVETPAKATDYVKVSYEGFIDGQSISEICPDKKVWAKQENTWEEAAPEESRRMGVPAVMDGILGMKAEDSKEVEMTFAEDHEVEALRGKTATYKITVHEVRERVLPELNEDFLKSLQIESVEQLKDRIFQDLEGRKKNEQAGDKRRQILAFLNDAVQIPVPETAVEAQTQALVQRTMMDYMRRGVAQAEMESRIEELTEKSHKAAEEQVKLDVILTRIAKKESVEVTDQDMQRAIMMEAMQTRTKPEEIVKRLQKDRRNIYQLQRNLLVDKTLEFLSEQAKVTETEKEG